MRPVLGRSRSVLVGVAIVGSLGLGCGLPGAGAAAVHLEADPAASVASATPSTSAQEGQLVQAVDPAALLSDFTTYWQPGRYDSTSAASRVATAYTGRVLDPATLGHNDAVVRAVNEAGADDVDQVHRALVDQEHDWTLTFPDALGPTMGVWLSEGVEEGDLPLTSAWLDTFSTERLANDAKKVFNYPRPYLEDRARSDLATPNDLDGLSSNLGIIKAKDWTDPATGRTYKAGYRNLADYAHPSWGFPSGHSTFAHAEGVALAVLVPELAPEILSRASEAANNRVVLGVHSPLDVIGGRIVGDSRVSASMSDPAVVADTVEPARDELRGYLSQRCEASGHPADLSACVSDLGANAAKGYSNDFVDGVAAPVTDRSSALAAYRARMSYGFAPTASTKTEPVVPEAAEDLLLTAFPTLTDSQRREVLSQTETASGQPLDGSSEGWERVDLAAAMSARVTLDAQEKVLRVETGQSAPSVVRSGSSIATSASQRGQAVPAALTAGLAAVLVVGAAGVAYVVRSRRRGAASAHDDALG